MRSNRDRRRVAVLALLPSLSVACGIFRGDIASEEEAAESFEPFASRSIAGEPIETFLRRRTATLVGGPAELSVEADGGRLSERMRFVAPNAAGNGNERTAALGAAAAVSEDGYFLTVAHALDNGPVQLLIEARGAIECAPARLVWSHGERDVALVHADLRPEAWFEMEPARTHPAGEVVLAFSHYVGPSAGALEVEVASDLFVSSATLEIPHDAPLRGGHSGSPAATLDGRLLGVHSSTGMDTIFKRRSFFVWVNPDDLRRRIDADRASSRVEPGPARP